MSRKNFILILLFIITIVLIGFVRFIIKNDTVETQKDRLEFFSDYLEIKKNYILQSYERAAQLAFSQIEKDSKLTALLEQLFLNDSQPESLLLKIEFTKHTASFYNQLKEVGFSHIHFVKESELAKTNNKQLYKVNAANNYSNSRISVLQGLVISNDFEGYQYCFPLIDAHKKLIGYFELGIEFALIQSQLLQGSDDIDWGFLMVTSDSLAGELDFVNQKFHNFSVDQNLWINKEIDRPRHKMRNTWKQREITDNIYRSLSDTSFTNFSIYLSTKNEALAISFSKIPVFNPFKAAYLLTINKDRVLTKTKKLNNAVFIFNVFIILVIMAGLSYLIANRYNLIKQKSLIQKSELKLQEINQSKDKFFSIVAHDLKNPFNGIMGLSGYLVSEYDQVNDDEIKEIINDINISSRNAFNLLQNLLEWTRTQSGTIKNIPVVLEPRYIVSLALETVNNLAKNKEIVIKETYQTKASGFADENLVSTVIRNLTTNAIKFSPRKSIVEIIVNTYKNELYFCVKDQGIGLRTDEIDKLFQIDVNFQKRGTEKETGTGLGLKLCKEFVEYCGGRIWVISEPQKGSSFYFTIPIFKA